MISRQYLLDKTGMWTSALCAVHCIAVPVLVTMSAFNSWAFLHDEGVENVVLMISALVAVSSLVPTYIKHHRKVVPVFILLSGFLLIGLSRFMVNVNESVLASSGATLIASAHFLNYRLCKKFHSA